jgi:Short C-terminal domain
VTVQVAPAATPDRPAPTSSGEEVVSLLAKLGELRDQGLLTAEEFEAEKKQLLDRI